MRIYSREDRPVHVVAVPAHDHVRDRRRRRDQGPPGPPVPSAALAIRRNRGSWRGRGRGAVPRGSGGVRRGRWRCGNGWAEGGSDGTGNGLGDEVKID